MAREISCYEVSCDKDVNGYTVPRWHYYYHADFKFIPQSLTWNTGNGYRTDMCFNVAGNDHFRRSDSVIYSQVGFYIGSGTPAEAAVSDSATASSLVGSDVGCCRQVVSYAYPNLTKVVFYGKFWEYDRGISVNNASWGEVSRPYNNSVYASSYIWKFVKGGHIMKLPDGDYAGSDTLYARPRSGSGSEIFGFWESGEKKTTSSPQSTYMTYSPGSRDASNIIAVFGLPFTIVYNANGGSGTISTQSLYYGVSDYEPQGVVSNAEPLTAPQFYVFDGWNTAADGSGVAIEVGADADDVFDDADLTAGGTVTLYAQWRFIGFNISVTRSESTLAGTLSLVNTTTGKTVATEANGTLSYTGEVGAAYQVFCTVGDGANAYTMPYGISGLTNDTFTPESGQTYTYEYSCPFYWVSLPAADEHGNVLSITSPSTYDTQITVNNVALPAYAAGRSITISAATDSEFSLESAILRDANGYSFATRSNIKNDRFTETIGKSFSVEPTYGQNRYAVSIDKDSPSDAAFSSVSAKKSGGTDAEFEIAGTGVTFSATVANGFAFDGFYLNGTKVPAADITTDGNTRSFTHTVAADVAVVVKAKVLVTLDVSPSGYATLTVDGEEYTPGTAFDVTLGDSFSYEVSVTEANKYFNGWFNASDAYHETPLPGYGDSKTVTPTAALDIYAYIGDIDMTKPVVATFAYANGTDATEGSFSVDGVVGPQSKTLSYDESVAPSVVLAVVPENGFQFAGLFTNIEGMGDPVALGAGGVLTVQYSRTFYVLFTQNPHAICEWEGSETPKPMTWRSKTYEASKPFNPSACRVDALGYAGDGNGSVLELTVDMFSAPNAKATATAKLTNIANQNARRLPVRRMERYMQVEVKCNREVDAVLVGTSMGGLAT